MNLFFSCFNNLSLWRLGYRCCVSHIEGYTTKKIKNHFKREGR